MKKENERLYNWASDVDDGTLRQAEKSARLPIVHGHVALMPDAHLGIGATVGSVVPTDGAIIPAAVGVDLGCGMAAVRFTTKVEGLPNDLGRALRAIEATVPAGVGKGHDRVSGAALSWLSAHPTPSKLSDKQAKAAANQFGTLGSGNHFVELSVDEGSNVWSGPCRFTSSLMSDAGGIQCPSRPERASQYPKGPGDRGR
jgi:tRNA-splicing ligase RtcB